MEIKIDIIAEENIKPSSPTPTHLKKFNLSLIDQFVPPVYTPLLLFYSTTNNNYDESETSQKLKKSLSETLTNFYPLAGRIKDNLYIDCNDEGVSYVETQVDCSLSDMLKNFEVELSRPFLPTDIVSTAKETASGRVLFVQTNFFKCGGLAIGLCILHKISDASMLSIFTNTWAAISHGSKSKNNNMVLNQEITTSTLFPPIDFTIKLPGEEDMKRCKCITNRFVFEAAKIAALQAKVTSTSVPKPTRVEALTCLIWKCATKASRSNSGFVKPSVLSQTVNLRKRVVPNLPENTIGNLLGFFCVRNEDTEKELEGLVSELRKGLNEFSGKCEVKVKLGGACESNSLVFEYFNEIGSLYKCDDIDFYNCTSWCRFPLYEADFGWGKPIWMCLGNSPIKNIFGFLETKEGDGVEAWVTLSEADMALFARDQELLAFGSLNPSVLD